MPYPGFFPARRQSDRQCNVDVEHVESAGVAIDLGKQAALLFAHPHHPVLHQYLVATLIKLTKREDVRCQPWQVVDVVQHVVLSTLAGELNGLGPLDPSNLAVPEADRAGDATVDAGERRPGPRHVIGGPGVQHPPLGVSSVGVVEGGEDLVLKEVE